MTVDQTEATSDAVLHKLADALRRVRQGDLKVRLPRAAGLAGEVADAFNDVVALQERRNRELLRISRVVGREGRMTERMDEESFEGAWNEGIRAVNSLIDDLGRPTTEIARVIVAVAEGDLTQKMELEIEGRPLRAGSARTRAGRLRSRRRRLCVGRGSRTRRRPVPGGVVLARLAFGREVPPILDCERLLFVAHISWDPAPRGAGSRRHRALLSHVRVNRHG